MSALLSGRPLRATRRDRKLFVDRERELDAVSTVLLNGANVLLLGPPGSGKSSFLHHLADRLDERDRPVVVVDGRAAASARDFLALLRDELSDWTRAAAAMGRARVGALAGEPGAALQGAGSETQTLRAQLAELRAAVPGDDALVLVDEMPSPQAAHALFGRLRDELWELPFAWLVAAEDRDRALYLEPPADAFWRRVVTLPPLGVDDSVELLRRRLPDEPTDRLDRIAREAGGNPRRVIALAYDVVVEGRDPDDVAARREERARREETLSEPARRLLAELDANGAASASDEGLLTKLGWTRSRASQVFRELESKGFVRATDRPGARSRPRRVYEVIV
jgi:AAA ATPase domain